jgi:hydrogenase nickel incorporation protein HypA/HybF
MAEIFEIITDNIAEYNLKKVTKVELKIGEMTCVEESALEFAFEAFSQDTVVENAELIIKRVEATAECENCKEVFKIDYTNKLCPKCNLFSSKIITGNELLLDSLEGE